VKTDPENSDSEDGFLLTSDKWARIAARKVIRVCILHSAYIHQVLWARPHPDSFFGDLIVAPQSTAASAAGVHVVDSLVQHIQ